MKCFVRGYNSQGFGSRLIKWFTFGQISHVSLVFDVGYKVEEVEAIQGRGVIKHSPNSSKDYNFIEFAIPISETQILDAHITACSLVGGAYDWKGLWTFLLRRDKHNPEKWFCSELVAYVLHKAGYKISRREPYAETPTSVCQSFRLIAPAGEVGNA